MRLEIGDLGPLGLHAALCLTAGDSSQDEAEDDVKQITVSFAQRQKKQGIGGLVVVSADPVGRESQ